MRKFTFYVSRYYYYFFFFFAGAGGGLLGLEPLYKVNKTQILRC